MDRKIARALRAAMYADGGSVDDRHPLRRAVDTGMDYAGRGLALADLYSGGMLSSVAGLNPFTSYGSVMEARDRALDGIPREAKAAATEPFTPYAAIFAGPMAKTANRAMLRRAEELAAKNAPREQIWNDTGWFKGTDGKWRFEIDDSGSFYRGTKPSNSKEFGDVMPHKELSDAYPAVKSITVREYPGAEAGGSIDPTARTMYLYGPNKAATGLHEAQHAVQYLEDFGAGGHPGASDIVDQGMLAMIAKAEKKLDDAFALVGPDRDAAIDAASLEKAALMDQLGWDHYRRLAGEVEAKTVEKRQPLTAEQRRARAPWLDYDVPESDQIVRFR